MRKTLYIMFIPVIALTVAIGGPVLARDSIRDQSSNDGIDTSSDNTGGDIAQTEPNDPESGHGEKLAAAKLRLCQNHERVIDSIMGRISERGQRRLDLYSTIADRVEAFYTKKGKVLSNYDALVNDVNDKKAAAQAAVDKVKADKVEFKCDGSDPKGVASGFKADLKLEIEALHAYQQSVKNLIVGVKSVQSEDSSNSTSSGGEQ